MDGNAAVLLAWPRFFQTVVDMDCKNGYNESKINVRSVKKHGKIYGRDL